MWPRNCRTSWDARREVVADLMIDTVKACAAHQILPAFRRGRLRRVG
jgi:hypothetical protein